MKKFHSILLAVALLFANSLLAFADYSDDEDDDVEKVHCYNGGEGASHCSITAGINVFGTGFSSDCSVDCRDGYYACCGLRCVCKKIAGL